MQGLLSDSFPGDGPPEHPPTLLRSHAPPAIQQCEVPAPLLDTGAAQVPQKRSKQQASVDDGSHTVVKAKELDLSNGSSQEPASRAQVSCLALALPAQEVQGSALVQA